MNKQIHNYDLSGFYVGSSNARINPLESQKQKKNIYLLPKNATFLKPPEPQEEKIIKWNGSAWIFEDQEAINEEKKLTDAQILENAKNEKLNEIYIKRQEYQYSNIIHNDHEYLNTITSQNKFFNLINSTDSDIEWRLADGSWLILNRVQITEFKNLIIQKETASYKEESRLITLINKAKILKDLEVINWKLK